MAATVTPAAAASAASLKSQQVKIASVVSAYFVISISLVFVNKLLLTEGASIPAPVFVTWFQCAVSVAICWALGQYSKGAPPGTFLSQFQPFTYKLSTARSLLSLSVVFVGMITFNNLSLKYVEVSFYNVARSLTIVFNVMFTFALLGERTSGAVLACLATVIIGFFVGAKGEMRFSLIGTLYGVLSSVFVSLNSIYTKKGMASAGVEGNVWTLSAYNNMNACLLFLPILAVNGEIAIIRENWDLLFSGYFWGIMILGGLFGFLITVVTGMQIKVTSPLTHNISGTAKACVQTVLALWIWRNPTSFENLLGVALVLAGSMAYGYVRNKEMEADNSRKAKEKSAAEAADRERKAGAAARSANPQDGGSGSTSIEDAVEAGQLAEHSVRASGADAEEEEVQSIPLMADPATATGERARRTVV